MSEEKKRLGVLVSGRGSNLRNLVERGYNVVAVATNRKGCLAAQWAASAGLPVKSFTRPDYPSPVLRDQAMQRWLLAQGVEIVVLAGYNRILSSDFVRSFRGRLVNIHPSLLPAFSGGMDAVEQALRRGVKISGCTVHLVTEDVDEGPILLQSAVPVLPGDTVESLHARIQIEEHCILPQAIDLLTNSVEARLASPDK